MEHLLVKDYDVLNGNNQFVYPIAIDHIKSVSIQIIWRDLVSIYDSSVEMIQSNNGVDFDTMDLMAVMSSENGSVTLADVSFPSQFLALKFSKNNCSGGKMTAILV